MEKLLTKHFWILSLTTLAAIAFLTASGASELVAVKVDGLMPESTSSRESKPSVRPVSIKDSLNIPRDGTPILKRNIFDSETGPIDPLAEEDEVEQTINLEGDLPIVPCTDNSTKLIATVASSKDESWSFANINNGGEAQLVRIGDDLSGRVVSGITWRYLLLRGSTDECYIDLFGDQQEIVKKARPKTGRSGSEELGDLGSQIEVNGPNERTVPRSVVDQALANPTQFANSVRVRPYRKDGEVTGFRLRRIQKGSPLELLGAQKGDIIHSVNGEPLTDVSQALAAYQNMRNEKQLVFSVTRQGKPTDLTINIK